MPFFDVETKSYVVSNDNSYFLNLVSTLKISSSIQDYALLVLKLS